VFSFLISLAIAVLAAVLGYSAARNFVARRLRYVDAAQTPLAPVVAGFGAWLIALPVVALIPFVGAGTAITFGLAVAGGVATGARDIRRSLPPGSSEL
jgi:hypothetical protein